MRSCEPAFHLLKRYRMRGAWIPDLHFKNGRRPDLLKPRVLVQPADTQDGRFEEGLRLDLRRVADPAHILEADDALSQRHGPPAYHVIRSFFASNDGSRRDADRCDQRAA